MRSRLLHGLLLGAAWCALAGLVESAVLLLQHPYERDLGLWLEAWPLYAGAGTVLGLAAGAVLPLLTRSREWRMLPGIYLVGILLGAVAAVLAWPLLPPPTPARAAVAALIGLAVQQLLRLAASSRWGWLGASLFTPISAVLLLALTVAAGSGGALLPPTAGPRTLPLLDAAPAGAEPAERPADLLVVLLRGVGAGHVGCLGYYRQTSPRLDALAREGVLYEAAFAASPAPEAARSALLGLAGPGPGLADPLRRAGYQVAGVGPAAAALTPDGLPLGYSAFTEPGLELPRQRLYLQRRWRDWFPPLELPRTGAQATAAAALDWLRERRDADRPFCLILDIDQALPPHTPPAELRERFLPGSPAAAEAGPEAPTTTDADAAPDSGADLDRDRALFDAELLSVDRALGQLIDGLSDLDLLEGCLVVVVGDRGNCFHPEHADDPAPAGLDCRTQVPLLLRMPRELPAGTRVRPIVSCRDLPATVLRFLGLDRAGGPSRALPPVGEADPVAPEEVVIHDAGRGHSVLRTPDAKLLRRADGALLLRDLGADPEEQLPMTPPSGASAEAAAALLARRLGEAR